MLILAYVLLDLSSLPERHHSTVVAVPLLAIAGDRNEGKMQSGRSKLPA